MLKVDNLKCHFIMKNSTIPAVDGVSFFIEQGEVLALVGESGCGKSVTALSLLRLIMPPGKIVSGDVQFQGSSLF